MHAPVKRVGVVVAARALLAQAIDQLARRCQGRPAPALTADLQAVLRHLHLRGRRRRARSGESARSSGLVLLRWMRSLRRTDRPRRNSQAAVGPADRQVGHLPAPALAQALLDQLVVRPEGPVDEQTVGAGQRLAHRRARARPAPRNRPAARPCGRRGSCSPTLSPGEARPAGLEVQRPLARRGQRGHVQAARLPVARAAAAARPPARAGARSAARGSAPACGRRRCPRRSRADLVGGVDAPAAATRAGTAGPGSGRGPRW